jgi:ketosteroid isomerase-like protein
MAYRLFVLSCIALAALSTTNPAVAHEPKSTPLAATSLPVAAKAAANVVDRFHAALKRGDTGAAVTLLAADALIFESGSVERSKAEYASHHLAADAAFAGATMHSMTRRSGSAVGDVAWIASEGKTTGIYKDRAIDSVSTETMILRRTNRAWQIVHIHWSSAKTK